MLVNKRRIISVDKYISWIDTEDLYVCVENNEDNRNTIIEKKMCCSSDDLFDGNVLMPSEIGPITSFNMNGSIVKRTDLKKEPRDIEHDYHIVDWHGGDHYGICIQTRMCYPREVIPPPCKFLIIDGKYIRSEKLFTDDKDIIKHMINMFLEIFGHCIIVDGALSISEVKQIKTVPWNILPPGKYPWDRIKKDLEDYLNRIPNSRKNTVTSRHKLIASFQPDFVALGQNSFNGYVVYGFEDKSLYFFESNETNNATYVFKGNWEEASKLTKRDIIIGDLCYKRLMHVSGWKNEIKKLLK